VTSSPPSSQYTPDWLHFTRGDGCGFGRIAQARNFSIEFRSATSRPDRIHPPPVTRTVLPALTAFHFQGASEYLEDLVARIDGPQVNGIYIGYLNQLVDFQVAQLSKFFDRSLGPKLTLFRHAQVTFYSSRVSFNCIVMQTIHIQARPLLRLSSYAKGLTGKFRT
jgi:hypothetical protein